MKRYFTLTLASLFGLLLLSEAKAQVPSWKWIERGSAGGYVYPGSVVLDENGNVFAGMSYQSTFSLGGRSVTNNQRDPDPGFFKLGEDGKAQWAKKLHSSGSDYSGSFCVDSEGRSYLVIRFSGTITISGVEYTTAEGSQIILAYKPGGELRWAHQVAFSSVGNLRINASGELEFSATYYQDFTWAGTEYTTTEDPVAFAAAYDLEGEELWLEELASNTYGLGYLTETEDGYYFFLRSSRTDTIRLMGEDDEILPNEVGSIYHICAYDKDWSLKWIEEVSSSSESISGLWLSGIRANSEGELYLYGKVNGELTVGGKDYPTNADNTGCSDGFMIIMDSEGSASKVATLGSAVSCDQILGMAIGSDDKVYVVGSSSTTINYEGLQISLPKGGAFLMKMDAELEPLWDIVAIGDSNGDDISFNDVTVNRRNDLIVMGRYNADIDFGDTSFVYSGFGANKYMFVAKVENDFTDNIAEVNAPDFGLEVFPNPGSGELNLRFEGRGEARVSVSNLTGQELWSSQVQLENKSLPVQLAQKPGVYFITLQTTEGTMTNRYILK